MNCNFQPNGKDKETGEDLFRCEKCGYETSFLGARTCKPIIQKQLGEPSLFKKIANFTYAFGEHLYKGMPTVNKEQLDKRLAICKECPLFKANGLVGGVCSHENCGCNIQDEIVFLNKIAWADQKCPVGKWGEIVEEKGENGV